MRQAPPDACDRLDHLAQARVDGLDRRHRGRDHAGVADHVGVGEVDDPELRRVLAPGGDERARRGPRAHLGLVVVGRHLTRRGHELAALAVVRGLLAAVEEIRDVRVLLGLGDVQLATAGAAITCGSVIAGCAGANATG